MEPAVLEVQGGAHPVVAGLQRSSFVGNDCCLDQQHSLWVITGPNMGGQSAPAAAVKVEVLGTSAVFFLFCREEHVFKAERTHSHPCSGTVMFIIHVHVYRWVYDIILYIYT